MKKIRTAVVGLGYLGQYHVQKYANLTQSRLVAVCDIKSTLCKTTAQQYQVKPITRYQDLASLVDAVSIVVPTPLHFEIAEFFINRHIHVLIEKPITMTLEEADRLIELGKENKITIQVGHLERFNNTIKALDRYLSYPRFIESTRLSPFKLRGSDVNVILDLMIHDIDIIQSLVKSEIHSISASGSPVLTAHIDIINARIAFANGCIANVTASRVSSTKQRTLRIFQHDCYISLDLDQKQLTLHRKGTGEMFPGIPEITRKKQTFEEGDALKDQIDDFLNAIIHKKSPLVSGEEGKKALAIAIDITRKVNEHNARYSWVDDA